MSAIMSLENNAFALAEAVKAIGALPIENTKGVKEATTVKPDSSQNEGHYNLKDGVVYEVYDKQGNVSFSVPQKLNPIDEVV